MPLVKIHILKGRSPPELEMLLDTIHDVVVESFGVPRRDRYQILQEHEASHIRALDTGLDITRTETPILLGRGIRLWDDLRGLETGFTVQAETAPSGTIHLTFRR
jgi:phenylpyruvate tautomerase PptA (4-oxalocrotonate tautomerase family)